MLNEILSLSRTRASVSWTFLYVLWGTKGILKELFYYKAYMKVTLQFKIKIVSYKPTFTRGFLNDLEERLFCIKRLRSCKRCNRANCFSKKSCRWPLNGSSLSTLFYTWLILYMSSYKMKFSFRNSYIDVDWKILELTELSLDNLCWSSWIFTPFYNIWIPYHSWLRR